MMWPLTIRPKSLKKLHRFPNKENTPLISLIWDIYYTTAPSSHKLEGSHWWKAHLKLQPINKNAGSCSLGQGDTILMWHDRWHNQPLVQLYHELHSFALEDLGSFKYFLSKGDLAENFHRPISTQAFQELQALLLQHLVRISKDSGLCGSSTKFYSSMRMCKTMMGNNKAPKLFHSVWKGASRLKHKFFVWLILHDILKTKAMMQRKEFYLPVYTCILCSHHTLETAHHLLWDCDFA